jgi:hypothetical protein
MHVKATKLQYFRYNIYEKKPDIFDKVSNSKTIDDPFYSGSHLTEIFG